MSDWTRSAAEFEALDETARGVLASLRPARIPLGTVLFSPGEAARGFVIVLSGRIEVYLTGPTGREILLYAVEPGQSCVQSTLGLLGGADYTGEAITATDCEVVTVPGEMFLRLMAGSEGFRRIVFGAFAGRIQSIMALLERVAFQKVESRLAAALLARETAGTVQGTHQDLAAHIGSAREVVSRRLEALAQRGMVRLSRGSVALVDRAALKALAEIDAPDVT